MSISSESTNDGGDITPADDQQVNALEEGNGQNGGNNGSVADQQLKEFQQKFAKMEMELKDSKQLCMTKDIEIKMLQTQLEQQKVMAKYNELQAKVAKLEQEQKEQHNEGDGANVQSKAILERIAQLEKQQQQKDNVGYHRPLGCISNAKFVMVGDNCWDVNACNSDLQITEPQCTIVHKENEYGWRSVFAKRSVPRNNSGIFYFEAKLVEGDVTIGLATKAMPLDERVGCHSDSYGYSDDGYFWANDCAKGKKPMFYCGDVIGCGVNLANGQLIFTQNGQLLDTTDFFVSPSSTDPLFPCVSLGEGDCNIEANFGPDFKFNIGNV